MKKYLLIALLLFPAFISLGQQNNEDPKDGSRLQAYKIAFLTQKLNLSPQEAQRFWPIYNKYEQEIRAVRIQNRMNKSTEIETEEKILNIRKKYNDEFGKALSNDKVNTFFKSERDFSNMVQRELMERRKGLDNRKKLRD
jgi:hypothetical protein